MTATAHPGDAVLFDRRGHCNSAATAAALCGGTKDVFRRHLACFARCLIVRWYTLLSQFAVWKRKTKQPPATSENRVPLGRPTHSVSTHDILYSPPACLRRRLAGTYFPYLSPYGDKADDLVNSPRHPTMPRRNNKQMPGSLLSQPIPQRSARDGQPELASGACLAGHLDCPSAIAGAR